MTVAAHVLPWLPAMAALLVASAFFSGSEAALFSLSPRDRARLARGGAGMRAAESLLERSDQVLSAILFWNLLINMTYFAVASVVGARLRNVAEVADAAEWVFAVASLGTIIFCGEMVPKSLAVVTPVRFAALVGLPLSLAVRVVGPVLPVVGVANLLARRLVWPSFRPEPYLEIADIERAIQLSTGDATLAASERAMLRRAVQLTDVRADEWMRPRSGYRLYQPPLSLEDLGGRIPESGYLLVGEPEGDEPVAAVALRGARPNQLDDLEAAAEPVVYVPWSASIARVLGRLRAEDRQVAAVVNEYGETVGILTIDDILAGVFREHPGLPDRSEGGAPAAMVVAPGVWQVSGMMSVRRMAKLLGVEPPAGRHVTVAGLLHDQNRRVPRPGDRCRWGPLELEVVSQRKNGQVVIEIHRASEAEGPK